MGNVIEYTGGLTYLYIALCILSYSIAIIAIIVMRREYKTYKIFKLSYLLGVLWAVIFASVMLGFIFGQMSVLNKLTSPEFILSNAPGYTH